MTRGYLYAIIAYVIWGVFPIYWKQLQTVSSFEIILHRIGWSFLFLLGLGLIRRRWTWLKQLYRYPRRTGLLAIAAVLLATNWFFYVWGVNHAMVVQASLGYFINPLVSVLLGVVILGERLRKGQWLAVGLATLGVLYLIFRVGELPWLAFVLAFSFGLYGLSKKKMHLGAIEGLTTEMAILFIPTLLLFNLMAQRGATVFGHADLRTTLFLLGTGAVTAIPLIFFGAATQVIPLSSVGVLQYITPSMQFLVGVLLYRESFTFQRFIGFALIWAAVILFVIDNVRAQRGVRMV